jgi:hypothetical protein
VPASASASALWHRPPDWAALNQMSQVKAQRAMENSAYVRKLLSKREPDFAAALTDAVLRISSCFGELDDQLRGPNALGQQVGIDRRQHEDVASVDDEDRLIDRRHKEVRRLVAEPTDERARACFRSVTAVRCGSGVRLRPGRLQGPGGSRRRDPDHA